jgi:hypothetical protein
VSEGEFGMPKSYLSLLFFSKALKWNLTWGQRTNEMCHFINGSVAKEYILKELRAQTKMHKQGQ